MILCDRCHRMALVATNLVHTVSVEMRTVVYILIIAAMQLVIVIVYIVIAI